MIYLASPYSDPDEAVMVARFEAVCREAAKMMGAGLHVFSPIAHTHPIAMHGGLPTDWQYWQGYDEAMIAGVAELIVLQLDGWESSRGIAGEIAIAESLGIPVRFMEPTK